MTDLARDRSAALAARLAHQASDLGLSLRAAVRRLLRMDHARGSETGALMTYDRAAIMRDAHKRFRDGKRLGLGWTFGQCLSTAWRAARERRKAYARIAA
jgi:hypothetical protein